MSAEDNQKNCNAELLRSDGKSRRFACDRCRGQKLRCERRILADSSVPSCDRCVKARCQCITSPPRRMGRPKHQSTQIHSAIRGPRGLDFNTFLSPIDAGVFVKNGFELRDTAAFDTCPFISSKNQQDDNGERCSNIQQVDHKEFGYSAQQLFADTPIFYGNQDYFNQNNLSQAPPPADLKEECLQKLSNLSLGLFKQWSQLSSGQLADWLALSPPSQSLASQITESSSYFTSNCATSPIVYMLDSSRKFLDILKYFLRAPSTQSSTSSQYSSPDFSSSVFGPENLSANYSDQSSAYSASPIYHYPLYYNSSDGSSLTTSDFTTSTNNPDPFNLLKSDVPTSLAILTCYIYLARIYSIIFSHIYNLLSSSSLAESDPIFQGLQLSGFQLASHRNFQIEILMQISVHMLNQIETTLGLPDDRCTVGKSGGGGVLEDSASRALLELVLNQEAMEGNEGDGIGHKPLRQILDSIKRSLRGNMEFR